MKYIDQITTHNLKKGLTLLLVLAILLCETACSHNDAAKEQPASNQSKVEEAATDASAKESEEKAGVVKQKKIEDQIVGKWVNAYDSATTMTIEDGVIRLRYLTGGNKIDAGNSIDFDENMPWEPTNKGKGISYGLTEDAAVSEWKYSDVVFSADGNTMMMYPPARFIYPKVQGYPDELDTWLREDTNEENGCTVIDVEMDRIVVEGGEPEISGTLINNGKKAYTDIEINLNFFRSPVMSDHDKMGNFECIVTEEGFYLEPGEEYYFEVTPQRDPTSETPYDETFFEVATNYTADVSGYAVK